MNTTEVLAFQAQEMAHQMGDDFGFEDSTVEYIATELQISVDEVREMLDAGEEYDGQPDEAQEWYDFDPDC
jgi:hypothetical protein